MYVKYKTENKNQIEAKLVHFIVYFIDIITLNSYANCLIFESISVESTDY